MEPAAGNLESWLIPRSERESLLNQALAAAAGIHALAPHLPPAGDDIIARIAPGGIEAALAFRGLEFARYSRAGLFFGLNDRRTLLHEANQKALDDLIVKLDFYRNSLAEDQTHPLYRAAPERWIETLIVSNPLKLDPQLDARFLYSQVPALAQDRGVIDLLGVTRRGRLVVMELKVSEDIRSRRSIIGFASAVIRSPVTSSAAGISPVSNLAPNRRSFAWSRPGCAFIPPAKFCRNIFYRKFTSRASASPKLGAVEYAWFTAKVVLEAPIGGK